VSNLAHWPPECLIGTEGCLIPPSPTFGKRGSLVSVGSSRARLTFSVSSTTDLITLRATMFVSVGAVEIDQAGM